MSKRTVAPGVIAERLWCAWCLVLVWTIDRECPRCQKPLRVGGEP